MCPGFLAGHYKHGMGCGFLNVLNCACWVFPWRLDAFFWTADWLKKWGSNHILYWQRLKGLNLDRMPRSWTSMPITKLSWGGQKTIQTEIGRKDILEMTSAYMSITQAMDQSPSRAMRIKKVCEVMCKQRWPRIEWQPSQLDRDIWAQMQHDARTFLKSYNHIHTVLIKLRIVKHASASFPKLTLKS